VDVGWCRAQYDAGVRTADTGVAELVAALERMGLKERTALIILGDHGESLGEHGIYFDHYGLYDEVLRPPLIIHWPGGPPAGRRIAALTQTQDLCPTVLQILGLPVPPGIEGRSLIPLLEGSDDTVGHRRLLACECNWGFRWAMRSERWKLIVSRAPDLLHPRPEIELYDIVRDPEERHNLVDSDQVQAAGHRAEFEAWLGRRLSHATDPVLREAVLGHPQLRWRLLKTRLRWDLWLRLHELVPA
jgi:arylsulfatase A-like enzyme